ncbi:ATP-binding protein [Pseudonocardia sp. ICBG601]|uniref:ATP-binding protein n=1 Tax=Pseudonocardia sp. ICBG601 TaxID=2846759 RepID=UPI001CF63FCB|nr:ATP-binding protein [Pseudonocardia sp. ICBG601]
MAWYRLAPQSWWMRADHEREQMMSALGLGLAQLSGRWMHWRVCWEPHPAPSWARAHDEWADPLPDQRGGVSWEEHLVGEQHRALDVGASVKQVYLGVEVHAGRGRLGRFGDRIGTGLGRRVADWGARWVDAELEALDAQVQRLDAVLAGPGLWARPVTAAQMLSLLYRSCALGLPPEAGLAAAPHTVWDVEDMAALDGAARWTVEPYAPTVQVAGVAEGVRHDRHLLIASVGRMGELEVPGRDLPWMTMADGARVSWSGRMRILPREVAERSVRWASDRIAAQQRHYEVEHGLDAPLGLHRQAQLAAEIRDDLDTDRSGLSARCEGWWRLAIAGESEQQVIGMFDELRQQFHPTVALERSEGQYGLAREFIPGEPLATRAFRRRLSVRHVAMAMPAASEVIGDGHGPLLFQASVSGRPLAWDPWHDMDTRQVSGLTPVVGGLGSGKTFLMGALAVSVVRARSAFVTLLDPSGPLTALCELPELAGVARAVSLLDAPAGSLNPYQMITDPARGDFPAGAEGDSAWLDERSAAHAQRTTLVISVVTQLLPAAIARESTTQQLILSAVHRVGSDADHDLGQVCAALAASPDVEGRRLAESLEAIVSPTGPARLLWGSADRGESSGGAGSVWAADSDRLLVISTRGLTRPRDEVDPADFSMEERLSSVLLHLAAWLAYRRVYEVPRSEPKLIGLDELRWLSATATGRTLITQLSRDNRKYRARVLVASQLASDVLRLDGDESGLAALCHDVFVGRTVDESAQAEALRLLRVPAGVGYEARLGELSAPYGDGSGVGVEGDAPREFLWRSGAHCEEVRLDLSGPHLAGLRAALDTNPARAATR